MFGWIRKRLGYHVCEEFTQWEAHSSRFSRARNPLESTFESISSDDRVTFTLEWQERRCTMCGKIERKPLPLGGQY